VVNISSAAVAVTWASAREACPKQMAHGPCAGVLADGSCEVGGPCRYLEVPAADWPYLQVGSAGPTAWELTYRRPEAARPFLTAAAHRPVVVTDLPAAALSASSLRECADELAGATDACLLGDHGGERVQLPPSYRARILADAGVPTWAGLNCRDRNRVALEGELTACLDVGVVGVHCVTGDHTALGHRPDAQPVFDLDAVGLVALARRQGLLVSVAHAPSAPPVEQRLPRLLAKVSAGADAVFVDHCGGAEQVEAAVGELRTAGFAGPVLACVPVATDAASAAVLASFAASRLPSGYLAGVLEAPDPRSAGVAAAVELAERMCAIPGVDGVNLSGGARPGHERAAARDLAAVGRAVLS